MATQVITNQASTSPRHTIKTDEPYTMDPLDKIILAGTGVIKLPPNPNLGDAYTIAASDDVATVDGNGHLIGDAATIELAPQSTGYFVYSQGNKWACSNSSSASTSAAKQATWYINSQTGNDTKNGKTPSTALKTFAEWQRRVGRGTVLAPQGGTLIINILKDLPSSDPVTFDNTMAAGCSAQIVGSKTTLRTGTFTAVQDKDRSTNQPYTITDSSLSASGWTPYIDKMIEIDGGSRAYVLADMGSKKAHVSEWMSPLDGPDGFCWPDAPATVGAAYTVSSFTKVTLGDLSVGYNPAEVALSFSPDTGLPGGLSLRNLNVVNATGQGDSFYAQSPATKNHPEAICGISECVIDSRLEVSPSCLNSTFGNTLFRGVLLCSGNIYVQGGAFHPSAGTEYPGAMRILPGGYALLDGDTTFYGDMAASNTSADLQVLGRCQPGPTSFWNTRHAIVVLYSGNLFVEAGSPFYGETGYVPFWGKDNTDYIFMFRGSQMTIEQLTFDADTIHLPTLEMAGGPGGLVADIGNTQVDGKKGHAWDPVAAEFTAPTDIKWAKFDVDITSGGFKTTTYTEPGFSATCANASNPGFGTGIGWSYIHVN